MAGRPRKQRITALKDRRIYIRLTEADYALICHLGTLRGLCPADTLWALAWQQATEVSRWAPSIEKWWFDEIVRIQAEENAQ